MERWQYDGGVFAHTGQSAFQLPDKVYWIEYLPSMEHPQATFFFKELF